MDNKQICEYIAAHSGKVRGAANFIETALRTMKGRVQPEDLEDARQELFIVMIECLKRHDPLREATFDAYANKSIRKKASGILEAYINGISPMVGKPGKKHKTHFVSMQSVLYSDEGEEYFGDSIADEEELVELLDARVLESELMSGLSPELRAIVTEWAHHDTLKAIGERHGMSYETVRIRVASALREMRTLLDDEKRKERLL